MALDRYDILAEELDLMANGNNPSANESKWKRQALKLLVQQLHNQIIRGDYNYNSGQEGIHNVGGQFLNEFQGVAVNTDDERDEKYVILPSSFVNLPGGKGIAEVYAYDLTGHRQESFSAIPSASNSLTQGLWATGLQGRTGYRLEGSRLYFVTEGKKMKYAKVNIKLVSGNANAVGLDQEILILTQATQIISAKAPEDVLNNNRADSAPATR